MYVFSKITTFETLSAVPHSQNSIGNWAFLTDFGNPKSDWNIKLAQFPLHLYSSLLTIKKKKKKKKERKKKKLIENI